MLKFLLKLSAITVIFFITDKLFLIIERQAPELEYDRRLEYCLEGKLDYDVMIFGSSRTARALLAEKFEEKTGLSAFNFAYHGTNLDFHVFLVEKYLAHNPAPKLIILGVDDYNSFLLGKTVFRNDKLYPLTKYPEITEELVRRGEKIALISDVLASHRINRKALFLQKVDPTFRNLMTASGSMPIDSILPQFLENQVPYEDCAILYDSTHESPMLKVKFRKFIGHCAAYNVPLLIVAPPNYYPPTLQFRSRLEQLTRNDARIFYYDESNPVYSDKSYFFDSEHVNIKGSKIYTDEVIDYIRKNYPHLTTQE